MNSATPRIDKPVRIGSREIGSIAIAARFLWERLDDFSPDRAPDSSSLQAAARRLERWRKVLGPNGREIFEKRLAWDRLSLDGVERCLAGGGLANFSAPPWASTLQEIMQAAADGTVLDPHTAIVEDSAPVPFEDLLLPAVVVARKRLAANLSSAKIQSSSGSAVLTPEAERDLERSLLRRLSRVCGNTLLFEFGEFQPFGLRLASVLEPNDSAPSGAQYYQRFVRSTLDDGTRTLFHRYPVLGRLVATIVDFWVESATEFRTRLAADVTALELMFADDRGGPHATRLGSIRSIGATLSDPHKRGRTVLSLEFDCGKKILYKPKDLSLELAFSNLLSWSNQRSGLPHLRTIQVLARPGYGWVECIEHAACQNEAEVELYYRRAGMLACILYVLRATDCHYENIVASAACPVLVDMETLAHPISKLIDDSSLSFETEAAASQALWDSVLRTGLLPRWEADADAAVAYDISGFGSPEGRPTARRIQQWKAINTDAMRREEDWLLLPPSKNAPRIGDRWIAPTPFRDHVVRGFEEMYRFVLAERAALLAPDGPIQAIASLDVRFVFRPTRTYMAVMEAACSHTHLKDGADFSIELDHLSRAFLVARWRPVAFLILGAELRALGQLDVPLFMANAAGDGLTLDADHRLEGYFKGPAYQDVRKLIENLGDEDLALQLAVINGAFDAKIATEESRSGGSWTPREMPLLERAELTDEARRIAIDLETRALVDADGSVNWIGLDYLPRVERFQLQDLNHTLGDGRGGVALFLAALAKVTGEDRYRDLALRALRALRRQVKSLRLDTARQIARFIGLGAASGLPSMIYCLTKVAEFIDAQELLADARLLLDWITEELIANDQHLDVLSGSAGAILALTTLHAATGEERALELAKRCAGHVLAHQQAADAPEGSGAPRAWKTLWEQPLTGYSHGAAGIAYALLRLYEVNGEERYLNAALAGIAYETQAFDEAQCNWPDLRRSRNDRIPQFATRWCHGAPGIGLARIGSARIWHDDRITVDIHRALTTTAACPLGAVDHLCCGNFGRIEVLTLGGRGLGRADWTRAALLNACNVVARARQTGSYQLFPNLPASVFNPGFLVGTAGIGYQLLRLADDSLPSVLLWE